MAEKKTTNGKRPASSRSASSQEETPRKNSRAAAERKAQAKRRSIIEDIVVIVVVGLSVLCYVAIFSSAIPWLKSVLFFLFGNLMYIAPLLFVILAVVLRMGDRTGLFIRRVISVVLILFAVSGLFSFFSGDPKNGGLLGRLNYVMMNKLLGTAGATVINIFLIVVAVVLFVDFSVFAYLKDKKDPEREENQRKRELQEEKREARRRTRQLESERRTRESIDEIHEKNRRLEAEERLNRRFVGIGDTTITSDEEAPTTFHGGQDATSKNTSIFNKYKNSGKDKLQAEKEDDDVPFDLSDEIFMPPIHLGDEYLPKDSDGIITSEMPEETPEERAEKADKAFREQLSPSDRYEKIVVTANGSIRKVETDVPKAGKKQDYIDTDALRKARGEQALNADGTPKEDASEQGEGQKTAPQENTADSDVISRDIAAKKASQKEYRFPPMRLLRRGAGVNGNRQDIESELQENARNLVETLKTFGINVRVTNITRGPSVTRYEIQPDVGVKVSRITALSDNIKMNLAATSIYMEAPIPGKSAIGIQVPNSQKTGVTLRDLLESEEFKNTSSKLAFGLGKDIEGRAIIADIARMPHLLIAGTTGSGKSVCQNTMIMSIIYHAKPTEVKMIMIDPKMVEMQVYNDLPHLLLPVITDAKKASLALNWACTEMDRRYEVFSRYAVRGIEGYNDYINMEHPEDEHGQPLEPMPEIVIFCDEMSDMMMQARKEVENSVIRLAQKARAAGIHLVLATQTPRADIVTGLIKANLPSRIALKVNSGLESRIILDMNGAEELLGHGDMLYFPMTENKPNRIQGAFVSDEELREVMNYIREQKDVKGGGVDRNIRLDKPEESAPEEASSGGNGKSSSDRDELLEDCGRFIIETQKASIGALQRKFSIGFNRAARIMDQLAEEGVVGEEEGTKPRRILMSMEQFNNYLNNRS